jgi:hypothetical protein
MKTVVKILFRLLAWPFVFGILLLSILRNFLFTNWQWLRHGGEFMVHDEVFNPESMRKLLKDKIKEL